jgi:hypothetical protein
LRIVVMRVAEPRREAVVMTHTRQIAIGTTTILAMPAFSASDSPAGSAAGGDG